MKDITNMITMTKGIIGEEQGEGDVEELEAGAEDMAEGDITIMEPGRINMTLIMDLITNIMIMRYIMALKRIMKSLKRKENRMRKLIRKKIMILSMKGRRRKRKKSQKLKQRNPKRERKSQSLKNLSQLFYPRKRGNSSFPLSKRKLSQIRSLRSKR